jgi:hypothetical protein
MTTFTVAQAQADMRVGYLSGAPGVAASATAWLVAAGVALAVSPTAAIWALLVGGTLIHPASILVTKLLGSPGTHAAANPLAGLALESTFWLLAGIAIALGVQALRPAWFFPAMLLLIGGRYLTFQTIYGIRLYWVLGAGLCGAGISLVLLTAPVFASALTGAVLELVFAAALYTQARRSAA